MTIVLLLLCALALTAVGAWLAHRRSRGIAWARELEAAFACGDRQEVRPPEI